MQSQKLATRNVKVGDPDLGNLKAVSLTFNCSVCGKEFSREVRELYVHFPVKHPYDNVVASFGLAPKGIGEKCWECVDASLKEGRKA